MRSSKRHKTLNAIKLDGPDEAGPESVFTLHSKKYSVNKITAPMLKLFRTKQTLTPDKEMKKESSL